MQSQSYIKIKVLGGIKTHCPKFIRTGIIKLLKLTLFGSIFSVV